MFTHLFLTLVTLFLFPFTLVRAKPCVAFNTQQELLAFGLDGKDWNAGTQDTWASGTATDITTSGRPPFDGSSTTCYLAEYTNSIYVINADSSNPSGIHIYDATAKSWSTQSVTTGSFDPASFNAILDHDTNVFYALSNGELYHLDMGLLKVANSTPLEWVDVEKAPFPSDYQPVMVLAQNHIFFYNVPGVAAGSEKIFVIHYNYWQPEAQPFLISGGGTIPATHGKAVSFFQTQGVQEQIAFVPDDCSATYVSNVQTNTTQKLAGPSTKDPNATYFAGITSLVQLDSTGVVSYLPFSDKDTSANAAATWSTVAKLAKAAPPTNSTPTMTGSGSTPTGVLKSNHSSSEGNASASQPASASSQNRAVAVAAPGSLLGGFVSAAMIVCAAVLL